MKRLLALCLACVLALGAAAQADVTTFMGIPVDGTKAAMRQALARKGFTPLDVGDLDVFNGEFNGSEVNVHIGINKSKVCRIMVCDAVRRGEAAIKNRFNNLITEFAGTGRYLVSEDNAAIPDRENISYEMTVNKKMYDAEFWQMPRPELLDTLEFQQKLGDELRTRFPEDKPAPTDDELQQATQEITRQYMFDLIYNKHVWFMIVQDRGQYYIAIYYDNVYNQAHGEDL